MSTQKVSIMESSPFKTLLEGGYAGLPIIPLRPRSKIPCVPSWSMYCSEMPTAELQDSWAKIPNANVGLALGAASGVIALDFDYDVDEVHAKILKHIPVSPIRKVGARGFTMFYKYNGETPAKWALNGDMVLELLSTGNHTVLPPSIHPEGATYRYSSVLQLVGNLDRLQTLPANLKEIVEKELNIIPHKKIAAEEFDAGEIMEALSFIDPNDYDVWLKVGMALKEAADLDGFTLWVDWSKRSEKCNTAELLPKWNSFKKEGISLSTIYYFARNNGYNRPEDLGSLLIDLDTVRDTINFWAKNGKPVGESYGWAAMDNIMHIRKGEFTIITGYTNQGKSEFMDATAVNLISNLNWKVGFLSMEKSKENHVAQLLHTIGGKALRLQSADEIDSTYKLLHTNALIVDHINIDKSIDELAKVIRFLGKDKGADAVVIDPFNYISTSDDSLYTHVMSVCKTCTNLAKELNIHIFLVAHAKDAQYDKEGRLLKPKMYSVFGGTQFSNIVDNLIGVTRRDSLTLIETLKIRDQDQDTYGTVTLQFNKEVRRFYEMENNHSY